MIDDGGASTRVDIAKARATIARMRTEGGGVRGFYAGVADDWSAALDALETAWEGAFDVVDKSTRSVKMLRDFIALVPDRPLRMVALDREAFPELFGDEDGGLMYLDEARRRILAKVNP